MKTLPNKIPNETLLNCDHFEWNSEQTFHIVNQFCYFWPKWVLTQFAKSPIPGIHSPKDQGVILPLLDTLVCTFGILFIPLTIYPGVVYTNLKKIKKVLCCSWKIVYSLQGVSTRWDLWMVNVSFIFIISGKTMI